MTRRRHHSDANRRGLYLESENHLKVSLVQWFRRVMCLLAGFGLCKFFLLNKLRGKGGRFLAGNKLLVGRGHVEGGNTN